MTEKQYARWQKMMRVGRKVCQCHQLPERSFFFRGMQFPVCARCTGILLGFVIAGPVISVFTRGNMYVSSALVLLMVLDGLLQLWKIMKSDNIRRLLTGIGFGYGVFSIVLHVIIKSVELIF